MKKSTIPAFTPYREGDVLWVKDPIMGERLARFISEVPRSTGIWGNPDAVWIQRRYNSRADMWGPQMMIPVSDILRVDVRV